MELQPGSLTGPLLHLWMLYTGRKFDKPTPGRTKIEVTRSRGSLFAPSRQLLDDYKRGPMSWEDFETRYVQEIHASYRQDPDPLHALVERASRDDITLTCWEGGDEDTIRCHRRLLRDMLRTLAQERGLTI